MWTPPRSAPRDTTQLRSATSLPADLAARIKQLTLTDLVDLALRSNPATQLSWANARSAASAYGVQRSAYFPTVDAAMSVTSLKTIASQGRTAVQQTTYGPSVTVSYLLFDIGGRSGAVEQARQALIAADWTHNATIQNVALQVEGAYFDYQATKGLLRADSSSVGEASAALQATEERQHVGLATIAEVLQARTALSQAQLNQETTEGALLTARGALAVAVGVPANAAYDVSAEPVQHIPVLADSVDTLIARAVRDRPDLAAAQAEVVQARARVRQVRSARLPSLSVGGTAANTSIVNQNTAGNNYTVTAGLAIPLFNGFGREYAQKEAEADAQAAAARASSLKQQVVYQVFSSYYTLQTAARRVRSADDLLNSAEQSNDAALARYKAGVGGIIDLLTAQSALAAARAQQVQARWIWQTALAQLAHDAGALDVHGESNMKLAPADSGPPPHR